MQKVQKEKRFILVNLVSPFTDHEAAEKDLEELKSLVSTFGGATIVRVIQRRMNPDPATFIGSGKSLEVADIVENERIDIVVINSIVKPSQLFNLTKIFWKVNPLIEVWDRIDLILHIFEKHAHTSEAKLQIDLARMRHMGPRIFGMGTVLSRQGGGIGTRGLGETNTELMKRHWRREMKVIQDKLEKLSENRYQQLNRRKEYGFKMVSIVGYTNAGKSTLFNRLSGKSKVAADVLFATLESNIGKIYMPSLHQQLLISDTIGFIQNLPAHLIEAFKSTLMEAVNADVLLHVIDASDHLLHEKIDIVQTILRELGIDTKPNIFAFNKMDSAHSFKKDELAEVYSDHNPQFISAATGEGIPELIAAIETEVKNLMLLKN